MIWIIASALVALAAAVGIGVTVRDAEKMTDPEFKRGIISIMCLSVATTLFLIAATICS